MWNFKFLYFAPGGLLPAKIPCLVSYSKINNNHGKFIFHHETVHEVLIWNTILPPKFRGNNELIGRTWHGKCLDSCNQNCVKHWDGESFLMVKLWVMDPKNPNIVENNFLEEVTEALKEFAKLHRERKLWSALVTNGLV